MKSNAAIVRELQKIVGKATGTVAGLYESPTLPNGAPNPKYNPDATANAMECSMRTKASLMLVQGLMAAERAKSQQPTTQVFGMVLMQSRIENSAEWERMAASVNDHKAIEAVTVDAKALPEK